MIRLISTREPRVEKRVATFVMDPTIIGLGPHELEKRQRIFKRNEGVPPEVSFKWITGKNGMPDKMEWTWWEIIA